MDSKDQKPTVIVITRRLPGCVRGMTAKVIVLEPGTSVEQQHRLASQAVDKLRSEIASVLSTEEATDAQIWWNTLRDDQIIYAAKEQPDQLKLEEGTYQLRNGSKISLFECTLPRVPAVKFKGSNNAHYDTNGDVVELDADADPNLGFVGDREDARIVCRVPPFVKRVKRIVEDGPARYLCADGSVVWLHPTIIPGVPFKGSNGNWYSRYGRTINEHGETLYDTTEDTTRIVDKAPAITPGHYITFGGLHVRVVAMYDSTCIAFQSSDGRNFTGEGRLVDKYGSLIRHPEDHHSDLAVRYEGRHD